MKNAIIIGAGPAGLTAAYQLLKETDIIPIILEESPYIGGISRTAQYNGYRMDLGGHRFFTKDEEVMDIWNELMPLQGSPSLDDLLLKRTPPLSTDGPDPQKEDKVLLVRNRVSRIFYLRKFFDYPISMKPETFLNMGFKRTMIAGFGYLYSCIIKRKEKSLEDFYINRFGKPLYSMFFEDYTEKLWGIHPSEIAPDWGAQRVKELSLGKVILDFFKKLFVKNYKTDDASLIEQFMYPKYGPGQLWETMADEIKRMGGEIHLQTKVVKIHMDPNGNVKNVESNIYDDFLKKEIVHTYVGDYYLSTMAIKDLFLGLNDTNIPKDVYDVATNLPYRDFITVGLLVDKLSICNTTKYETLNNLVPDCWIYIQERDVKIGRLQIFNNWSPYLLADYTGDEEKVWIGLEYFATEGDDMWNMSSEEFTKMAIGELEKINIIPKDSVKQSTHIQVKKAYPAYFGVYKDFDKVKDYLSNISNLYCMGRNGQHRYNNMDHSMLTAIEAVNLIKTNNLDKSSLWNVNTKAEYHETKSE